MALAFDLSARSFPYIAVARVVGTAVEDESARIVAADYEAAHAAAVPAQIVSLAETSPEPAGLAATFQLARSPSDHILVFQCW